MHAPAFLLYCFLVASCRVDGRKATRDDFIGRMYNVTRSTCLNAVGDCDWANYNCAVGGQRAVYLCVCVCVWRSTRLCVYAGWGTHVLVPTHSGAVGLRLH